jgi:hypothetical protein
MAGVDIYMKQGIGLKEGVIIEVRDKKTGKLKVHKRIEGRKETILFEEEK